MSALRIRKRPWSTLVVPSDPVSCSRKQMSSLFLMPSTLFLPPRRFLTLFSLSRMSAILPTQESHALQSAFLSFSRTNDLKKKKQETCSQIICLDFSSGPRVRCLSYIPHGVKEIHRTDLFFCFSFWYTFVDSFRWMEKGLSHTYTCFHSPPNSPPFRLPCNVEQSSLCYTGGPYLLHILNITVCTCSSPAP